MLLRLWSEQPYRATRDLDLLRRGDGSFEAIRDDLRAIVATPVAPDAVSFDGDAHRDRGDPRRGRVRRHARHAARPLRHGAPDAADRHGARRRGVAGAADLHLPDAARLPRAEVLAYPREAVVAEKLEAMVVLGDRNSRIKDFFDLHHLASRFEFDRATLAEAVRRTFERRNTPIPVEAPIGPNVQQLIGARRPPCWPGASPSRGGSSRSSPGRGRWASRRSSPRRSRPPAPVRVVSADEPALRGPEWIAAQWEAARLETGPAGAVLVIDEVQKAAGWSESVKRLWDEDTRAGRGLRVVLLGSAPLLVEQGLSESLAGRFEIIRVPHWSLAEMRAAFGITLDEYVYFGGYPGAAPLIGDEARWRRYILDALIETTISRDVLLLTRVDKPALLRRLFELGCRYSGQELSYTKMLGQLHDAGNTTTLAHYLELLAGPGCSRACPSSRAVPPPARRARSSRCSTPL